MRTVVASAALLVAFSATGESWAQGTPPTVGPGRGAGTRSIDGAPPPAQDPAQAKGDAPPVKPADDEATPPAATPPAATPPAAASHRRGRAPKTPSPTLPDDAPRTPPDPATRRAIAQGALTGDAADKDDPELRALREAEQVLFPRPLDGVQPGWSWELPQAATTGPTVSASGVPPAPRAEPAPDLPEVSSADAKWLASLTLPNLPVRLDARVVKYLKFYRDSAKGRSIARVWAKKSGKYTPALKAELAKQGLPTDLVWLSLIESSHNPTIKSPAGAAGLWQFIPESGRLYGLTVDRWVDERLDPERSTQAAALFLRDLHQRFGSWELAMAAYNMGYGGVSRAIKKYNTNDFWELARHEAGIPWETTLYVPKIMATAIVMNNKKAFGIDGITPDEPVSFDTVRVAPGVSLSRVAAAAEVALPEIQVLNPQLLADRVPPSEARGDLVKAVPVRVPVGKGVSTSQKLANVSGPTGNVEPYVVRFGDTAELIAKSRRTSERELSALNGLASGERLTAGTVLLVPRLDPGMRPGKTEDEITVVASSQFQYANRHRIFYTVRAGDSLPEIAAALDVSEAELVVWNSVDPTARLLEGMVLQVFVPPEVDLERVRYTDETDTRVLVVGSEEFFDHFEGLKGKKRIIITAQAGDTLAAIGERYGMTVGWMERVNRRARTDAVVPGEPIVVYAARGTPGGSAGAPALEPLTPATAPFPDALPPSASPGSEPE